MHLSYLIHERSGRVLIVVVAAIVLGMSFAASVISSAQLQDVFDRLYGFLD
jgi:hypothetical protein